MFNVLYFVLVFVQKLCRARLESVKLLQLFSFTMSPMLEFPNNISAAAHAEFITQVNTALASHVQRRGLLPSHQRRAGELRQGIQEKQALLAHNETQQRLEGVTDKISKARALPYSTSEELFANTLAAFNDFLFISDRDGSMTQIVKSEKEYLLPHGPGSVPLEYHLDTYGRESLPEAFAQYVQPLLRRHPEVFYNAGRHAGKLRDGVVELFTWLKKRGTPRRILSANWGELVRGGLAHTPLAHDDNLVIHAVEHNDMTATDKSTALQLVAADNPQNVIVYVGDGLSDMKVVDAYKKGVIGWIFAWKDSPFDRELTAHGIIHSTYTNYHEIQLELERADNHAQRLRQQAA